MTEERIGLENLQTTENAGFEIMKAFIIDNFSESYLGKIIEVSRREFAKQGFFGWHPSDANIVVDVSPMPDPWRGQWGYRIRTTAMRNRDDICVNQFYAPASSLPAFKKGDLSTLH